MTRLDEQQTEKLLDIIVSAVRDFREISRIKDAQADIRRFPIGGDCSAYQAIIQEKVSMELEVLQSHRLNFMIHDLSEFLTDAGISV